MDSIHFRGSFEEGSENPSISPSRIDVYTFCVSLGPIAEVSVKRDAEGAVR